MRSAENILGNWKWMLQNLKHLVILSMLSALRHGWVILALCVEFWIQTAKPHSSCCISLKRESQSSSNWSSMIEQDVTRAKQIKALSFPLAAFKNLQTWEEKNVKCVFMQHSNHLILEQKAEFKLNQQISLVALLGIFGLGTQPQLGLPKESSVRLWDWTTTSNSWVYFCFAGTSSYT